MMRLKSPLALIAALLAGVAIVSAIIYSTYRSMESEADKVAVQAAPSPVSMKSENHHPDSSSGMGASSASAIPSSSPSSLAAAAPSTPTSSKLSNDVTTEEVVVEEAPAPPSAPIPGAFAMAKLTNVPGVDQERLADIAQDFADKVKAAGWDTTSPAYHEAWKKAAEESEEVLKTAIGVQAWQELKMRQAQED